MNIFRKLRWWWQDVNRPAHWGAHPENRATDVWIEHCSFYSTAGSSGHYDPILQKYVPGTEGGAFVKRWSNKRTGAERYTPPEEHGGIERHHNVTEEDIAKGIHYRVRG